MWEFSRIKGREGKALKSIENKRSRTFLQVEISKCKERKKKNLEAFCGFLSSLAAAWVTQLKAAAVPAATFLY